MSGDEILKGNVEINRNVAQMVRSCHHSSVRRNDSSEVSRTGNQPKRASLTL